MATSAGDKLRIEALEVELADMKQGFSTLIALQQHMAAHIRSLQQRFLTHHHHGEDNPLPPIELNLETRGAE